MKERNLDLVAATLTPGHRALNPIEHTWSPVSGKLAGAVLADKLPGERLPPARQNLGVKERKTKEAELFNSSLDTLSNLLDGNHCLLVTRPFLLESVKWGKQSKATPLNGFTNDGNSVPDAKNRTAKQKPRYYH